jgi:hypothetical protein
MIDRVHHFIRFHCFITSCFINISMPSNLLTAGPGSYITVGYKPLCKHSMLVNVTKIQMSIGIGSSKHPQELLGAVHFQCLWRPAASVPSMWSAELNASSTPIRAMWISWGQLISVKRGNTIDTYCHTHTYIYIWRKNVPGLWQIGRYESGAWKPRGSAVDSWQTPFLFNPVWSAATNHRHGHHNSPVGTVAPTIIPLLPAESCRFPIPAQPYSASLELFCMLLFKRCPVTAHP